MKLLLTNFMKSTCNPRFVSASGKGFQRQYKPFQQSESLCISSVTNYFQSSLDQASNYSQGPLPFRHIYMLLTRGLTIVHYFTATFDRYYFLGLPLFTRAGHRRGLQRRAPDTRPLEKPDTKYQASKQAKRVNKKQTMQFFWRFFSSFRAVSLAAACLCGASALAVVLGVFYMVNQVA